MNKKNIAKATLATFTLAAAMPFSALAATDTQGHWAQKNLDRWEQAKMMVGYADGTMRPDNTITRAEFVSFVNRAAGFKADGKTKAFIDVVGNEWFATEIDASDAYLAGYPDGTFKPNANITRAEAAAIIARIMNLPANPAAAAKLADAASQPEWAMGAIGAVVEAGYMLTDANGNFNGDKLATRAETVYALDNGYTANVDAAIKANTKPAVAGGGGGGGSTVKPESKTMTIAQAVEKGYVSVKPWTNEDIGMAGANIDVVKDKTVKQVVLKAGTPIETNTRYGTIKLKDDYVITMDMKGNQFTTADLAEVIDVSDMDKEDAEALLELLKDEDFSKLLADGMILTPETGSSAVTGTLFMTQEAVEDLINQMVVTFE